MRRHGCEAVHGQLRQRNKVKSVDLVFNLLVGEWNPVLRVHVAHDRATEVVELDRRESGQVSTT